MRISPRNVLSALADADIVAVAPPPGYAPANLVRGPLARGWRTPTAVSAINIILHTKRAWMRTFGVFGLTLEDKTAKVDRVIVKSSPDWPTSSVDTVGELYIDERGDAMIDIGYEKDFETIRFEITLAGSSVIRIGKLWAGALIDLPAARSVSRNRSGNTIRNVSDARTFATATIASPTSGLDLEWPPISESREQEIRSAVASAGYGARPVVAWPDPRQPTWCVYGYLSDDVRSDWDASRLRTGLRLTLEEEGRAIGG